MLERIAAPASWNRSKGIGSWVGPRIANGAGAFSFSGINRRRDAGQSHSIYGSRIANEPISKAMPDRVAHQLCSTTGNGISRRHFLALCGFTMASGILVGKTVAASSDKSIPSKSGVFEMIPLPYGFDALEPYIDSETMHLHYEKHYAAYTKNLNGALEKHPELQTKSIEQLLGNIKSIPEPIRKTVRNNGGGYYNHGLFWRIMGPRGGSPEGALVTAINQAFGSVDEMKKTILAEAASVFGSGWAWLVVKNGKLEITTTPNQDSPIMSDVAETVGKPILGIDVWEHAYYLKYKNERTKYLDSWWNVVDWKSVGQLFAEA